MPLFTSDWLNDRDVRLMNRVARSMYFDLLCHEWMGGPLPDDMDAIATLLGELRRSVAPHWTSIRGRFEVDSSSRLHHPKLESLRNQARIKSEKAATSAKAKHSRSANAQPDAMPVAMLSESESKQSHNRTTEYPLTPNASPSAPLVLVPSEQAVGFDLDAIYSEYPRKVGRGPGIKALKKQIKTAADFSKAMQGVIAFAVAMKSEGRPVDKIPYFSTWANQEQWRDYAEMPATAEPTERQYKNFQGPRPAVAESKEVKL